MKKKFSALTALALTLAMILTACSGGGGGETTAAAGGDTKAAGETAQAAAPSGDAVKTDHGNRRDHRVHTTPSAESLPMS